MNENLNLVEILKDCPRGTKLYSPIVGEVEFVEVLNGIDTVINTISKTAGPILFYKNGQYLMGGECLLFPSKEQRDWSKFTAPWCTKERDTIDWLEKQGEQKKQVHFPKFTFDDVLALQCYMETVKKVQEDKELYEQLNLIHNKMYDAYWLGKQGETSPILSNSSNIGKNEQKSADKIEPKFNIGDWVVNKFGDSWHIDSLDKKNYQVSDGKGNYNYFPIPKQDEMHLWTIQDAKDGDVLEFGDHGGLVVGIVSYINKSTGKVDVYCLLENNKFKVGNYYALDTIKPHPASIEKRDTLMKAMTDAGYEWDAEKKELKYKLTEFENAIKDMMDNYRAAIDEDEATAEEVKKRSKYLLSLIPCELPLR